MTPWFDLLNVAPDELADVIEGTGWSLVDVQPTASAGDFAVLEKG